MLVKWNTASKKNMLNKHDFYVKCNKQYKYCTSSFFGKMSLNISALWQKVNLLQLIEQAKNKILKKHLLG